MIQKISLTNDIMYQMYRFVAVASQDDKMAAVYDFFLAVRKEIDSDPATSNYYLSYFSEYLAATENLTAQKLDEDQVACQFRSDIFNRMGYTPEIISLMTSDHSTKSKIAAIKLARNLYPGLTLMNAKKILEEYDA